MSVRQEREMTNHQMVDTKKVGNRLLVIASWLMAMAMLLLTFTIQETGSGSEPTTFYEYLFEAVSLVFLIVSLACVIYNLSDLCRLAVLCMREQVRQMLIKYLPQQEDC